MTTINPNVSAPTTTLPDAKSTSADATNSNVNGANNTAKDSSNTQLASTAQTPAQLSASFHPVDKLSEWKLGGNLIASNVSAAKITASNMASENPEPVLLASKQKNIAIVEDIKSVGSYAQGKGEHAMDIYQFTDKYMPFDTALSGGINTVGIQGCTITGLTNALGDIANKAGLPAPSVRDTNQRNDNFLNVFNSAKFTNLLGNGEQIRRRQSDESKIPAQLTQVSIAGFSSENKMRVPIADLTKDKNSVLSAQMRPEPPILKKVRDSLNQGNPVILGMTKNADVSTRVANDAWGRHTVVAIGIDKNNNIRIRDSADGSTITLKEAVAKWGDNNIDMAYSVSAKTPAETKRDTQAYKQYEDNLVLKALETPVSGGPLKGATEIRLR
jgi:hypothetical protein